jgi:ribonuclease P protein component
MRASRQQLKILGRLKNRADFLKMNTKGEKWVSHGLIIQAMPNDVNMMRVGFTVSKRTEKSAVKRNRIKRRLRAVAADVLPLYARPSCDYVLIGRPLTATRPYETLCNDLKWCLHKMGYAHKEAVE